jgi:beta-xylosidase
MYNDNRLVKLKSSLVDALEYWINTQASEGEGRDALGSTYLGEYTAEFMADAAFVVLLAQADLTDLLRTEGQLKEGEYNYQPYK